MAEAKIKVIVRKRASVKSKITRTFTLLEQDRSLENFESSKISIQEYLVQIESLDCQITELYEANIDEVTPDPTLSAAFGREIDGQAEYLVATRRDLIRLTPKPAPKPADETSVSDCKLKLPDLPCDAFDGEGKSNFEFHTFLSQFNNVVGFRKNLSSATKLTYLKSYLKGYAHKLVQNLTIIDGNYQVALDLLKKEFLNTEALVDELFRKLYEIKPEYDKDFTKTKIYINDIKCILADLATYERDLLANVASSEFVGHVVFNKLPYGFRQELVRKVNSNYPTIKQIFDNYVDVVKTLNLKSSRNFDTKIPEKSERFKSNKFEKKVYSNSASVQPSDGAAKEVCAKEVVPKEVDAKDVSKEVKSEVKRNCKWCNSSSHSMLNCKRYPTHDSRVKRCRELNLCLNCTSLKHHKNGCRTPLDFSCYICESKSHISALCPRIAEKIGQYHCLNSSNNIGNTYILPTLCVSLFNGKTKVNVKCLLDTGSQRSYLSHGILKELDLNRNYKETNFVINTFVETAQKKFQEVCLPFQVGDDKPVTIPFLIDKKFNLSFQIDYLKEAHHNVSRQYRLADQFTSDEVVLDGLLGVDALQYLGDLSVVECLGGVAFKYSGGYVPYGHVDNFLFNKQLRVKYQSEDEAGAQLVDSSIVNRVLEPVKTCFDPVGSVTNDSLVEGNVENLFKIEAMGITEDSCDYDEEMIKEFNSKISFKDGFYEVELPWHDKIENVQSNYAISKQILDKVLCKLQKEGLYDEYNAVLEHQVLEGILEPVNLNDINVNEHVWIPHRAVLKSDNKATTKLRVVLNCSMKVGDAPSLNEAAYPGVNLLNDLLKLLIKCKSDDYLVISDVKSAYLMVKLKLETDKNLFSILWRDVNGNLQAYRYRSIVFGYSSSSFILAQVIRHHIANYPQDLCSDVLTHNMYVDNLVYTGSDPEGLIELYEESRERMAQGGFNLRSWNTNCPPLKDKLIKEETISSHGEREEKLLGYVYDTEKDTLRIASSSQDDAGSGDVTKRRILSRFSALYDPLGLSLPVLVQSKILLKDIWNAGINWDERLPEEFLKRWVKISQDLAQLNQIEFPRKSYKNKVSLYLFTDASKDVYGFCCFARYSDGKIQCNQVFPNVKIPPLRKSPCRPLNYWQCTWPLNACPPS